MSKIGIMGGTFDPIHKGHLAIADQAAKQFGLDKVLFITGGNPPHKQDADMMIPSIRHKMVCMAIENRPKFEPCDYEIKKETYSYTVETLEHLKKQYKNSEFFLIIGADSFHNIVTWRRPRTIMELSTLLVYEREGYDIKKDYENLKKEYYVHADIIDAGKINLSSTMIREMISLNQDISGVVPKSVYEFIKRNNLYKKEEGNFKTRLEKRLKHDRFIHSIGVSIKAVELAKLYGVDENKAKVAAILHDCAKNIPLDEMLLKCKDYDVELDEFEKENPALIHAKLGEKVAEIEFGIRDREVLEAIKWHTTGCPGMSNLAKIIFVSDMIEPGRKYKGIRKLKATALVDLNEAVKECTNATIEFNLAKNNPVHPMAYKLLEWLETQEPIPAKPQK